MQSQESWAAIFVQEQDDIHTLQCITEGLISMMRACNDVLNACNGLEHPTTAHELHCSAILQAL